MSRTNNALMMSMGTVNMWGFSPAYDVCSGLSEWSKSESSTDASVSTRADDSEQKVSTQPINVLLAGPGDVRHVLATIARRRRWEPAMKHRPVHIYIFEKAIETLSRDLLLIQVALDAHLPLRQRCNLFLEIFGNSRVQERTSAYIEEQAKLLIDFVYNDRGSLAGLVDLSQLKMRTHDDLIDLFRSWFQNVKLDVDILRDHRLRHYYEVRYDYRDNLIDWDYTMKLKKIENASVIHIRQYRDWRNSGVAFEFGDQTYTAPNRTMAAYTEARGLWTDIIVSPYISFGVHCEKPSRFVEQLFEIHNKGTGVEQNRHNTGEVAVFNVLSYLYEIETGKMYQMGKIVPLTGNIEDLFSKKRYTGLFDYAFISSQQCHTLQPSEDVEQQARATITNILKDGAVVDVESSVFMLPLNEEQRALYVAKLQEWTAHHSLKPTFNFEGKNEPSNEDMTKIKNAVLRFSYGAKKTNAI
ncbi:Dynein assembly factor 3, C-terminal domain [Phytophthora cactorum]|nr:Dynein assembly factor 3, C-terminal domain [Phytophthora cactorum]